VKQTLSAVIAVRDEAEILAGCLKRLDFVDEIVVVVDDRTSDDTAAIAEKAGAKVFRHTFSTFSDIKNFGIDKATSDWILIIDGDERVPKVSASKILEAIQDDSTAGYTMPWDNYFLGHLMKWGDWQETHTRLFQRQTARYEGDIHETLVFKPDVATIKLLDAPIVHFSHRSITHNVEKTAAWATVQAQEMLDQNWPPVRLRSLIRVMWREFYRRLIRKRGYRDGMPGIIEGIYQVCSWFIIYARLWELQQNPSLEEQYRKLEDSIDA